MAALMKPRRNLARVSVFAALACLIGLACNTVTQVSMPSPTLTPGAPVSTPTASPTPAVPALATPYAHSPAAGICASFDGPVVEFWIEPGIPDPRCARARPDQQLKVTNSTDGPLDVSIGRYSGHIEPGGEFAIEAPFSSYLAPGVHQLRVLPCCGPEIVLEQTPP
jgi:hypothetical protein